MSSFYFSAIQGAIAGGAAAHLSQSNAAQGQNNASDPCMRAAFQINHLLLLAAETMHYASLPLTGFGLLVQAAYICAPLALIPNIGEGRVTAFLQENAEACNKMYKVGVVVTSVATLLLGNWVFATASLGMLAFDSYAGGPMKEAFVHVKKVAAVFAFVGYGSQVFMAAGILAGLAKVSTLIVGGKLVFDAIKPYYLQNARNYQFFGARSTFARPASQYHLVPSNSTYPVASPVVVNNYNNSYPYYNYTPTPSAPAYVPIYHPAPSTNAPAQPPSTSPATHSNPLVRPSVWSWGSSSNTATQPASGNPLVRTSVW